MGPVIVVVKAPEGQLLAGIGEAVEGGGGGNDTATQAKVAEHIANTISLKIQESMADQMRYRGC